MIWRRSGWALLEFGEVGPIIGSGVTVAAISITGPTLIVAIRPQSRLPLKEVSHKEVDSTDCKSQQLWVR